MAHIFVGLGGTGNGVLKRIADKINANERLSAQLRSKPDVVFWMLDCDQIPDISGVPVVSTPLQVIDPENAQNFDYKNDIEFQKWFDPYYRTKGNVNTKDSPGAGQIKMSGRYSLWYDIRRVQEHRDRIFSEPGIEFKGAQVHIVASLFGGTGAGMLFDVAYLMKERIPQVTLYLLEPSFLRIADPGRKNVYSWKGAYASLVELDFWMANSQIRSSDQQFNMYYKKQVRLSDDRTPGFPVYLFCATDQYGRSLAATGKNVHGSYQKFISSVLFERSFNYQYQQYYQTNLVKNLEDQANSDPSGHSRGFASFGITYLRFPREKFHEYFANELVFDLFYPKYSATKESSVELNKQAYAFMSDQVGVAEKENKQLSSMIMNLNTVKGMASSFNNRVTQIRRAKSNKDLPRDQISFDFNKLENEIILLIDAMYAGKKVQITGLNKSFKGFVPLLQSNIFNMLERDDNIPDIINYLKHMGDLIEIDKSFIEKYYAPAIDQYHKKNLEEEINKLYNRLRVTKTKLFSAKEFNRVKHIYLQTLQEYYDAKIILSWHRHVVELLEKMSTETNRWIRTLEYVKDRISHQLSACEPKAREALSKFKEGLFIYDKALGQRVYVFELHIGDTKNILSSELIQKGIIEPIKEKAANISKAIFHGSQNVRGIISMIEEVSGTTERELNELKGRYHKECALLFDTFIFSEIKNKVDSIGLKEVLNWQIGEIYIYVKDLEKNKKTQRELYEETIGKMNAMFGGMATKTLLQDLDEDSDEWVKNAQNFLIRNIQNMVHPLWMIDESGKSKTQGSLWYYIFFPRDMDIPENIRTGQNEEKSEWYDDRMVFLNALPGIRLNELENLTEFKDIYLKEKELKRPPNVSATPPIFSDFRFYTEWEWDLDIDVTQMMDAKLLQNFAFALLLEDNGEKPLIERKKTKSGFTFSYNPNNGYKGRKTKKLGDGLAKSYESLNKDIELRNHFKNRFNEAINKELYSVPEDQRFNRVMDMLRKTQQKWAELRPPEIPEGRKVKTGGNPVSRAYFYWKKMTDWLSGLSEKINHNNYNEYLR